MTSMVKTPDNAVKHGSGFSFKASGKLAGDYDIQLIGDFNQDNAMAAGLACLRLGASLQDIKEGIVSDLCSRAYGSSYTNQRSQGFCGLCSQWR